MSRVTFGAFHPERVADAVRQPPLETLVRRARIRRRRRRALAAVAFAALALAGALSLLGPPKPAGSEPMDPHHSGTGDVVFVDPRTVVEVSFTPCYVVFAASVDGG